MARTARGQPQHPPRQKRNAELGASTEERDRHLRYAHEQYTASGQKGRAPPMDEPTRNADRYPRGARMPWPDDATVEADKPRRRPSHKPVGR
jgi:hypothetical protein